MEIQMRKRKPAGLVMLDPTIPDVAVRIGDEEFHLCFDFAAMATAKARLRKSGVEINLLRAIDFRALDVDTLPALFFAAAQRYHPDLDWERAQQLVSIRDAEAIALALFAAYRAAMLEKPSDPHKTAQTS